MNKTQSIAGNAVLLVLFITLILIAVLFVQYVSTRSNLTLALQRTNDAQLGAQAIFTSTRSARTVMSELPPLAWDMLTPAGLDADQSLNGLQGRVPTLLPCVQNSREIRLFLGAGTNCGTTNPTPLAVKQNTVNAVTTWQVPLLLQVVSKLPDGSQKTRRTTGSMQFKSGRNLSVTAMQIFANELTQVPSRLVFDGPVHINGEVSLEAGRSAWPGGLTSAAGQINLGDTSTDAAHFRPNPSFPCSQADLQCPSFGGGLNLAADSLPMLDPKDTDGALTLSASIRQLVLFPLEGATGFFACTSSSCDVYQADSDGVRRILSGTPVPTRDGKQAVPAATENTPIGGVTRPIVIAPADLEVRALKPTGAAYTGLFSIIAEQDLTVGSSLQASVPVCTTYPVLNDQGDVQPAECMGLNSPDGLGLVSRTGNVLLGNRAETLFEDEQTLKLQADLLAARGGVMVSDDRLQAVDWIGSVAANQVRLDRRFRLAHDPRALNLPGFPTFARGITPIRITFGIDKSLD